MPIGSTANSPDSAHKETNLTLPTFAALGLSESLLRALASANYETPTPIQAQAIPPLLQGRDLLGIAQTGTGKTAAFVLPLLQMLGQNRRHLLPRAARALILAPTRELAAQISDSVTTYGRHCGLRHAVIMGGVSQRAQVKAMARGVDILIATPGRLLDLIQQRQVDLGRATHLVLDEADRMLDMGFIRDVRKVVALMPKTCQSLLFSATMPKEVARLANDLLKDPVRVEIAAKTVAVERIDQRVHHADSGSKRKLLTDLLADSQLSRVIVFTRTKRGADRVAKQLAADGVRVAAIHGDKSQGAREKALDSFRAGRSACWSRPISSRVASTSTTSRMSSTTSCRPTRKATSIASAVRRARVRAASPSPSAIRASATGSATSSGCSSGGSPSSGMSRPAAMRSVRPPDTARPTVRCSYGPRPGSKAGGPGAGTGAAQPEL